MLKAIVSVRRAGDVTSRDIEVPAELALDRLVPLICQALGWPLRRDGHDMIYQVTAYPSGGIVRDSLAAEGLWDGTCLVFEGICSSE
jgi:hypothetical protein